MPLILDHFQQQSKHSDFIERHCSLHLQLMYAIQIYNIFGIKYILSKIKMEKQTYEEVMKSIRQSQQKSRLTLQKVQNTLNDVRTTLSDIKQTTNNIDQVKEQFNCVMDKLASKIANSFNPQLNFKKQQYSIYDVYPREGDQSEVVQAINNYDQILILTGAGVSAASGIPTFRGKQGLYSKKFSFQGVEYEPEQFITKQFYDAHPEPIWEWIQYINKLSINSQPNQIHKEIDRLAKILSAKGKHTVLATQNIDDLHLKPMSEVYQYYNIHGNCKKVHCKNLHFKDYSINSKNQICDICQQKLRPNVLFFDQSYGQHYGLQVQKGIFDFVIVIGTSLKTGLCIRKVSQAKQIVQINPKPQIQVGNVHQFTQDTAKVLMKINQLLVNQQNIA